MATAGEHERGDPPVADGSAADQDRYIGWRDLTVWTTPVGRFGAALARRAAGWIGLYPALVVTTLVGLVAGIALTAGSAEIYEAVVDAEGVAGLDQPVLDLAVVARRPWLNTLVTAFTDLGGPVGMPILATVVTAGLAVWSRRWTPVALMAVAAGGSLLMTVVGKAFVGRTRPPLVDSVAPYETSASFPSGHSLNAVVIAGVVAYLLVPRLRRWRARMATVVAAAAFAAAMGLSRVYLGHHWLTDVLVAWTLGLAWLSAVIVTHRLYLTVRAVRPGRPTPR